MRNFINMVKANWKDEKFVCVGLDTDFAKNPESIRDKEDVKGSILRFNMDIIDETCDIACVYKPNWAFYLGYGPEGYEALAETVYYINDIAPNIPIIIDAKVADIDNTNLGYVKAIFDYLGADAVTVHPYLGAEALSPFLKMADKGIIVLGRTSNKGGGEFQDRLVGIEQIPLYKEVVDNVATSWNKNGNCAIVAGATYPEELAEIRKIVGSMPLLIPGIGAQKADIEKTVMAGRDSTGEGMLINSSRGIIYASSGDDFAQAARAATLELHNAINQYRLN